MPPSRSAADPAPVTPSTAEPRVLVLIPNEILADGRVVKCAGSLAETAHVRVIGVDRGRGHLDVAKARSRHPFEMRWIRFGHVGDRRRGKLDYVWMFSRILLGMVARGLRYRPDVVFAMGWAMLQPAKWICRLTGARLIYDCVELFRDRRALPGDAIWRRYEDWAFRHADRVTACNVQRAEIMREEYGCRVPIELVPNYVPFREIPRTDTLRRAFAEQDPQVETIVLYHGAHIPGRALDTLIDAVAQLPPSVGIAFVGAGDPTYLQALKDRAAAADMTSRCLFHGTVPFDELLPLATAVDVGYVAYEPTNRNNELCAPNKLYEYALAGIPMVGSDLPPIRDYFDDVGCGLTFEPGNADALAARLRELAADPQLAARLGQQGTARVREFTWERNAETLQRMVAELSRDR